MVARTIPLTPFLPGRGKIIGGLEGHPPDLLPEGTIPSGRPLGAGGHPETPGSGTASLCTLALRMAGEFEYVVGGHHACAKQA